MVRYDEYHVCEHIPVLSFIYFLFQFMDLCNWGLLFDVTFNAMYRNGPYMWYCILLLYTFSNAVDRVHPYLRHCVLLLYAFSNAADRVHPYPRHGVLSIYAFSNAADRDGPYPRHGVLSLYAFSNAADRVHPYPRHWRIHTMTRHSAADRVHPYPRHWIIYKMTRHNAADSDKSYPQHCTIYKITRHNAVHRLHPIPTWVFNFHSLISYIGSIPIHSIKYQHKYLSLPFTLPLISFIFISHLIHNIFFKIIHLSFFQGRSIHLFKLREPPQP